ncbi:hypothetical protein ACFLUA_04320 [Chloroflexota bacterium]
MKIQTDIKSGGVVQDAAAQAGNVYDKSASFVSKANQEAENVTKTVTNSASSAWDYLFGP